MIDTDQSSQQTFASTTEVSKNLLTHRMQPTLTGQWPPLLNEHRYLRYEHPLQPLLEGKSINTEWCLTLQAPVFRSCLRPEPQLAKDLLKFAKRIEQGLSGSRTQSETRAR